MTSGPMASIGWSSEPMASIGGHRPIIYRLEQCADLQTQERERYANVKNEHVTSKTQTGYENLWLDLM